MGVLEASLPPSPRTRHVSSETTMEANPQCHLPRCSSYTQPIKSSQLKLHHHGGSEESSALPDFNSWPTESVSKEEFLIYMTNFEQVDQQEYLESHYTLKPIRLGGMVERILQRTKLG